MFSEMSVCSQGDRQTPSLLGRPKVGWADPPLGRPQADPPLGRPLSLPSKQTPSPSPLGRPSGNDI